MALGAIIGGGLQIASGIFGNRAAKRAAAKRNKEARRLQGKLDRLEMNRQQIINPYENVQNLSGMLSNPFADLSVATQAAEMQAEQSDQALANTLDTIRETGGGAGSATALAQAALQAKKGVAASIESQEAANEKQRAAGEQTLQNQLLAEEKRVQQADVSGRQFVFEQTEKREMQQLDRLTNQIAALRGASASAQKDANAATSGILDGLSGLASGLFSGGD
tara:strand:- start:1586 stop:2251 length:666 start_codon:yes stop_codon:yes gene_type:complete